MPDNKQEQNQPAPQAVIPTLPAKPLTEALVPRVIPSEAVVMQVRNSSQVRETKNTPPQDTAE